MKNITSFLLISGLLLTHITFVSANTPASISPTIGNIQDANPAERGFIGNIIANIFQPSGRIKTLFLSPFQLLEDTAYHNTLPRWTKADIVSEGRFEAGTIRDNGTNIGVGGNIDPNFRMRVYGNTNLGGNLTINGNTTQTGSINLTGNITADDFIRRDGRPLGGKFIDGVDTRDAVYSGAGKRNVGINIATPEERLHVNGNIRAGNIFGQDNQGSKVIGSGINSAGGANIILYGSDHSVLPNLISLRTGTTPRFTINGTTGNVSIGGNIQTTGKIYAQTPNSTDPANTVVTKGYIDTLVSQGGSNEFEKYVPLVNLRHTIYQCRQAGGIPVKSNGANGFLIDSRSFCKFSRSSCPSGWTQYGNWKKTTRGPSVTARRTCWGTFASPVSTTRTGFCRACTWSTSCQESLVVSAPSCSNFWRKTQRNYEPISNCTTVQVGCY